MPSHNLSLRRSVLLVCLFVLALSSSLFAASDVVISQAYGGGGNSGSTYKNDFIEIFNRGSNTVNLAGWSVQYNSASGTGAWQATPLSGQILPGQYLLIQEAAGTGGTTNLPTPDFTGTIPMGGGGFRVALVQSTTLLTGTCPTANVLDMVGAGSTATCVEGTFAPAPSNTLAVVRAGGGCTDTDNNGADFTAAAPNPRNSQTTLAPCGTVSPNPAGLGTATPSPVDIGAAVTLKVAVSGGTPPYQVAADLTSIGGIADTTFTDADNDNTFEYVHSVSDKITAGTKTVDFTITDAAAVSGSGSITVEVVEPLTAATISEIQGLTDLSPLVGKRVVTSGIVTAVRTGKGFYIQSEAPDTDPLTSEGIYIFTGSTTHAAVALGNKVTVEGTVTEYFGLTEITPTPNRPITLDAASLPLPGAVSISSADLATLEAYESMRVSGNFVSVTPTEGSINESAGTATSNGRFWAVFEGMPRPFREPGLEPGAKLVAPNAPAFDGNPERLRVETGVLAGSTKADVSTGVLFSGSTAVLDYAFGSYSLLMEGTPTWTGGTVTSAVANQEEATFSIGTWNLLHFYDTASPNSVSAATLDNRLGKASKAVREVLGSPAVLAVQEVENLGVLQALADKINADAVAAGDANPQYAAYLEEGNDIGGIDVGFLVRLDMVEVDSVTQYYKDEPLPHPDGKSYPLFDRPPFVLHAKFKYGEERVPVAIVNLHLRSLNGVEEETPSGQFARDKRQDGAEKVASLLQQLQGNSGENYVVALGDLNAYEFNDGYVDVVGTLTGAPAAPDTVWQSSLDYVEPNFHNISSWNPAEDRYSYTYGGNAQSLDHILVSSKMAGIGVSLHYGRLNADFPTVLYGDGAVAQRLSDHDPLVATFLFPAPPIGAVASAAPAVVTAGDTTLLTVAVTPSRRPTSTGIAVKADLTAINGPATAALYDDGTHGDVIAGDNVFSLEITVDETLPDTAATLSFSVSDAEGRNASGTLVLDVAAHPAIAPTATAAAVPAALTAGDTTLLTLTVVPGDFPASTGLGATADLAAIGGTTATMYDDGTHGDATASDNVFSLLVTVPDVTPTSAPQIAFTVADAQSRTATASLTLNVTGLPSTPPSATATASPATVFVGANTLVAVTVTPGKYPASSDISVIADLTVLGSGAAVALLDDGSNGDVTAGDYVFSRTVTVPANAAAGAKSIAISVADGQGRSASSSVTLTVPQPDYSVEAANGSTTTATVKAGETANYSLTVSSVNGFQGTVSFTCSGVPAKTSCAVSPGSVNVNGGSTANVVVTVFTQPDKKWGNAPAGGVLLMTMLLGGCVLVSTRSTRVRAAGSALVLVLALGLSACGGGSADNTPKITPGTAAGTYTVTVTANSGGTSHQTTLTLNVQK